MTPSPRILDSSLLFEEEQERHEAIEEIQATVLANSMREDALKCFENDQKNCNKSGGRSIYWNIMSKSFLKKLWLSHDDENDVVCNN